MIKGVTFVDETQSEFTCVNLHVSLVGPLKGFCVKIHTLPRFRKRKDCSRETVGSRSRSVM